MHGLVLVINHSVFLDLRFGTASQKTSGRHTPLVVSRKDLSHIYIHLNDSVFGIFIDSLYFGTLIILEKRPIRKCLYVRMYVMLYGHNVLNLNFKLDFNPNLTITVRFF